MAPYRYPLYFACVLGTFAREVREAPMVCHQFNEATGLCVDSHSPASHIWPRPRFLTADNSSSVFVELSNSTFSIVAKGGAGPLLNAAIKRFHAKIFSPVASVSANTGISAPRGDPIVLSVVVSKTDNEA